MVEVDFLNSVDIKTISAEKIISGFIKENKKILYLGNSEDLKESVVFSEYLQVEKENLEQIDNLETKFDYAILTDILEEIDNPQDLIKNIKNKVKNTIVYEYKFDEGCYENDNWKKPWTKVGLEYFLGREFDYVNSIFLGYATIHICNQPYDYENDDYRVNKDAIR